MNSFQVYDSLCEKERELSCFPAKYENVKLQKKQIENQMTECKTKIKNLKLRIQLNQRNSSSLESSYFLTLIPYQRKKLEQMKQQVKMDGKEIEEIEATLEQLKRDESAVVQQQEYIYRRLDGLNQILKKKEDLFNEIVAFEFKPREFVDAEVEKTVLDLQTQKLNAAVSNLLGVISKCGRAVEYIQKAAVTMQQAAAYSEKAMISRSQYQNAAFYSNGRTFYANTSGNDASYYHSAALEEQKAAAKILALCKDVINEMDINHVVSNLNASDKAELEKVYFKVDHLANSINIREHKFFSWKSMFSTAAEYFAEANSISTELGKLYDALLDELALLKSLFSRCETSLQVSMIRQTELTAKLYQFRDIQLSAARARAECQKIASAPPVV